MPQLSEEIQAALVANGIAGPHLSHSRHNAIGNLRACVEGDPDKSFGLSGLTLYSEQEAMDALARATGCSNDLGDLSGVDTIEPALTVAGIVAAGERLREEAARGATLLACTGHPTGVLELYMRIVDAYLAAGGKVARLHEEEDLVTSPRRSALERAVEQRRSAEVRYVGGVGCLADWGQLKHTHGPEAMEVLLEMGPLPDLVLGDHGFAGAAIERQIPTIAIMDINDPALAIAWAEGRDVSIVPLDDNRPPRMYEPVWQLFEDVIAAR